MGCCISTPNTKQDQNGLKNQQPQLRSNAPKPTPPPLPPQPEEESVKEVLLETPISKPQQVSILMTETNTQMPNTENRKVPIINKACSSMSESFSEEEVSQISETCTISESFSTTTTATTVTEKREDEATSKRCTGTQNRNRSQSKRSNAVDGNRIGGRERRPNSPATMPEKRIPVSSLPIRRRESGQVRRDPGEGSRRRSRSPSYARTVSTGAGRSQVKPPGGAGLRLPPAKCVENVLEGKENDVIRHEESIENPHVSLECFIFL